MRPLPALVALGSLAAFAGMVLVGDPEPIAQKPPVQRDQSVPETPKSKALPNQGLFDRLVSANAPSPFAHGGDAEAFLSYLAKRDAQDFAHLFNIAARMGATGLEGVNSPLEGLRRLSAGVPGKGEIVFRFRELTEEETRAAIGYLEFDGDRMSWTAAAEYTDEELEVRQRITTCKDGECRDCSDPRLRLQARQALAQVSDEP